MEKRDTNDVHFLLKTVVDEGRSLVRVQQPMRTDEVLQQVAVVTDDVLEYDRRLAAGRDVARDDVTRVLLGFEQRYRAIETSLAPGDVLALWIEGELSGRISDFVAAADGARAPRRSA